ncbi:MAG: hypothetical protein ACOY3Z_01405 [Thermodesulfobacteriota bacterium]
MRPAQAHHPAPAKAAPCRPACLALIGMAAVLVGAAAAIATGFLRERKNWLR